MALVVVDGEPASLKALELCCVPGVIIKQHESDQLVVVHVWRDHDASAPVAPVESSAPIINKTGTGLPPPPPHQLSSTPSKYINPQTVLQNGIAVATTINYVLGNRYAQSSLNYKIETLRLQQQPEQSSAGVTSYSSSSRATPALTAGATKKLSTTAIKLPPTTTSQPPTSSTTPQNIEPQQHQQIIADIAQQRLSAEVATYALLRSDHHRRELIIFGVGNKQNEKKQHAIGSCAKAMLDQYFSEESKMDSMNHFAGENDKIYELAVSKAVRRLPHPKLSYLAIKSTGTTIRPTSTIKYLVLLQLDYQFQGEARSEVNAEGTTVVYAPTPTQAKLSASSKAALNILRRYARPDGQDNIGALFIPNDGIPMAAPPPDPNSPPKKAAKNQAPPSLITLSDTTVADLDELVRPVADEFVEWTIENGLEKKEEGSDNEKTQPSGAESEGDASTSASPTTTSPATTGGVPLVPLLTKSYLELSRESPAYPLSSEVVPLQVAKIVNSIKPDIMILPSSTSRAVVEALMAMPKPHLLLCNF